MSLHSTPMYITTPIYYVNDRPHIGHAYSSIAADLLVRYHQLRGRPTRLTTGTDEHGQKIERRAREEGLAPQAFVDRMAPAFRDLPDLLHCRPNDFVRTTETRHKQAAQALWKKLEANGDIYLGAYEGWYSVHSEAFYTEKDLIDGKLDPISKKPVEKVKEPSYFFRLSQYTERLLDFYERNPDFVQPVGRMNEVKRFVQEGLNDLSISRTTFRWGVPVPDAHEHVMYVWLDALTNYLTSIEAFPPPSEASKGEAFSGAYGATHPSETQARLHGMWPPKGRAIHIVGKDILRFHAVYWPAFLMSAGMEPPSQIWAHGWLTVDGEKMSKSTGNFVPPEPLCELLGADVLRYYLMRDIAWGQDGDFSHRALAARYQGDLGNGLGNLLHRMIGSIAVKGCGGVVPHVPLEALTLEDLALVGVARNAAAEASVQLEQVAPARALDAVWTLVSETNRYVDQMAPWALLKTAESDAKARARLDQVVYTTLEALRYLSVMLWPWMPEVCDRLRDQLGLGPLMPVEGMDAWPASWGGLTPGTQLRPGAPLFPRLEPSQEDYLLRAEETQKQRAEGKQGTPVAASHNESGTGRPVPNASAGTPAVTESTTDLSKASGSTRSAGAKDQPGHAQPAAQQGSPAQGSPAQGQDASEAESSAVIAFDDFLKVDLRLGEVKEASRVPKSDKLLELQVDVGEPAPRQILAGIGKHYAPEDLIGKRLVVVVNLQPRKMMGRLSHGMVLAASDASGLSALFVDKEVAPGVRVS